MAKVFTSIVSMEDFFNKALSVAIEKACNRLLGTLQQLIDSEYYDQYEPEKYIRTMQFWNSAMTKMLNQCSGIIFMDKDAMDYGEFWNGELQLEYANQGYHGSTVIQTEGKFWDSFIEFCNENALNILKEEIRKQGISVK